MRRLTSIVLSYFSLAGFSAHIAALVIYLSSPELFNRVQEKSMERLSQLVPSITNSLQTEDQTYSLDDDIFKNFSPWEPLHSDNIKKGTISINGTPFASLNHATKALKDGDTLILGEGIYTESMVIRANGVTVLGRGHVIIEGASAEGKGAIVIKGNNSHISNIECRNIRVPDNNGSCIRHEGKHLKLTHTYFHDSQQGVLTGKNPGIVTIEDSRFEKLGYGGQSHGIYMGGGELYLANSLFIAAKSEGHEIKSRALKTVIRECIITSLSSNDSRLIDIPNGGILTITDSILHQGPKSANQDLIGYGLEGMAYDVNRVRLTHNTVLMERPGHNILFHKANNLPALKTEGNVIIATDPPELGGFNLIFKSREEAGMEPYPALPPL